jgi:hypothetical protein
MPNLYLGLMRVASWLLFSMTRKTQPKPPRRPTLGFTTGPLPDEIHSIVRLTWYREGRPVEVDQFQIDECEDAEHIFHYTVGQCLRQGADVCVLTAYSPEQLGVPTT